MKESIPKVKEHAEVIQTGLKYLILGSRITARYPEVLQELPPGYRGMILLDMEKCTSCSLCARICPANAMKMYVRDNKRNPGINYMRCVFCGFCVDICPVGALEYTDVHDTAYHTLEDHVFEPERFAEKVISTFKEEPRKVRVIIHEKRGLKYEST
ncbi:MAG: NuoI/complex I 23 kDa subunit family protein [Candidatus Geothermarchaeales archaeon]